MFSLTAISDTSSDEMNDQREIWHKKEIESNDQVWYNMSWDTNHTKQPKVSHKSSSFGHHMTLTSYYYFVLQLVPP